MIGLAVLYTGVVQSNAIVEHRVAPEKAVDVVSGRLKRHRLWDFALVLLPPLAAFFYLPFFLHSLGVIEWQTALLLTAGVFALGLLALIGAQARRGLPARWVARLIDARVAGKDRFLTLATIDPARYPASLHERLRAESAGLLQRLNLKLAFPYRIKRSFWGSAASCIVVLLLFHLFFYLYSASAPGSAAQKLQALARDLRQNPRLAPLANNLAALLRRLEDPQLKPEEKRSMIEQMRQQIAEQKRASKPEEAATKDSLQRAEEALEGLEKGTQGNQKGEGGGGISADLQQKGAGGQEKESKGSGGEGQGEQAIMSQQERQDGKPMKPTKGEEKGPSQGGRGQGESQKQDPNAKAENEGAQRGETEGKGGTTREGEVPSGPTPERFQQPGEQGEKGLRGAGYVTVELPEVETTVSKSGRGETKKMPRANAPVSNVPLPPASGPESAREKQQLPLEYRGLIR
jgi:hypothetical protein